MKLIPLVLLTLSLTVDIQTQEHYTFPPQFQTPNSGLFSSDSSLYLPPEPQTPIPLYPVKNTNHFPFQYLPPSGSKTPVGFLKPFPILISSTHTPFQEDDDDDGDEDNMHKVPVPQFLKNQLNRTDWNLNEREIKQLRPIPRITNYQNNIDRIDTKVPYQHTMPTPPSPNQASKPHNVKISENRMNDRVDLVKAASFPQYIQQPPPGVYISSSTEPAIPILRLSNEMDLDGSFSYEALGADQTHYVQHSRMENMGTDKEEQVVEGSYSYVGDNGQTYTVHYIADSNGFRASGDHLPVAPPIPEIIQRSVQYNLAEEAKKPPHLKSWQYEDKENESSESEKSHRFAISPPRNLFTGRAPESFSYNFAQGNLNSQNNLETAESSQTPVKAEYKPDQMKSTINSGTISPQITFLASQGAHVPSINNVQQNQQAISRIFNTEKPSMPQLIHYDAGNKESEDNKALWRWQYGLAVNANQNHEKNTISRSFAEGDDVMINFGDMTPEQYTSMMRSQLQSKENEEQVDNKNVLQDNIPGSSQYYSNMPQKSQTNDIINYQFRNQNIESKQQADNMDISLDNTNSRNSQYYLNNPRKSQWSDLISNQKLNMEQAENIVVSTDSSNDRFNNYYLNTSQKSQSYDLQNSQIQKHNVENTITNHGQASSTMHPGTIPHASNTYKQSDTNERIENENANSFQRHDGTPRATIITQREFIPPSQSVTKSYDYEDISYQPKRIKTLNYHSVTEPDEENLKVLPLNYEKTKRQNVLQNNMETVSTLPVTEMPLLSSSSASSMRFTDFIVPENTDDFKPLFSTIVPPKQEITTTTEGRIEDIIQENIFLRNIFNNDDNGRNMYEINNKTEKSNTSTKIPDMKTEKTPKYIQYQLKSSNSIKTTQHKPMDMSQILNYITAKNLFEPSKIHPKPDQSYSNFNYKYDDDFYDDEEEIEQQNTNPKPMPQPQPELRGIIKNYKVLHRNNSQLTHELNKYKPLQRNLAPPPLKAAKLPPLGRAGPSTKSYLPPIYV